MKPPRSTTIRRASLAFRARNRAALEKRRAPPGAVEDVQVVIDDALEQRAMRMLSDGFVHSDAALAWARDRARLVVSGDLPAAPFSPQELCRAAGAGEALS